MHRSIRPGSPIVLIPIPREPLPPLYSWETARDEDDSPPLSPLTPPSAQRSNGSARIEDDSPPFPPLSLPPHRKSKDSARLVDSSPPFPIRSPLTPPKSNDSARLEDSSPPFPPLSPLPHRKLKASVRLEGSSPPFHHPSPLPPQTSEVFARLEHSSPPFPHQPTPPHRKSNKPARTEDISRLSPSPHRISKSSRKPKKSKEPARIEDHPLPSLHRPSTPAQEPNDAAGAGFEMPDVSPLKSPRARRRARKKYWESVRAAEAQGAPPPQRQLLPVPQQIEGLTMSSRNPHDYVFRVRRTDGTEVEMRMSQMVLDGFHNVIADWSESGRHAHLDESSVCRAYWEAMKQGWQPPNQLREDYADDGRRRVADTLGEVELGQRGPLPVPLRILTLRGTRAKPLKPRRASRPVTAKNKPRPVTVKNKSRPVTAKNKSRPVGAGSK